MRSIASLCCESDLDNSCVFLTILALCLCRLDYSSLWQAQGQYVSFRDSEVCQRIQEGRDTMVTLPDRSSAGRAVFENRNTKYIAWSASGQIRPISILSRSGKGLPIQCTFGQFSPTSSISPSPLSSRQSTSLSLTVYLTVCRCMLVISHAYGPEDSKRSPPPNPCPWRMR